MKKLPHNEHHAGVFIPNAINQDRNAFVAGFDSQVLITFSTRQQFRGCESVDETGCEQSEFPTRKQTVLQQGAANSGAVDARNGPIDADPAFII